MPPRRLPAEQPGQGAEFRWGRARVRARPGDSVASALLASGHGVLSRSIKYHRPRGYYCGVGTCANCLVTIDGRPSVRACMVPAREGMAVKPQNCWPSPRLDVLSLAERFLPAGFDPQRAFTRPLFLLPAYHFAVRHMAGLGKAPRGGPPARVGEVAREEVPLAVVGAGPAGLAAAREAARAGVRVRVFDASPWPGGRLGREAALLQGPGAFQGHTPAQALGALLHDLREAGAAPEAEAGVAGLYPGKLLAVATPRRLVELRADAVVLATGAPESLPLFGDNDRPGVMTASAAGQLLGKHRILPGERVVLLGADERACALARSLEGAGARVAAVFEAGPTAPEAAGLPVKPGDGIAAVEGAARVRAVRTRRGARVPCDLVVLAWPRRPAVELFQQAGCALRARDGVLAPRADADLQTTAPGVFAAGDALAPGSLGAALASGALAGMGAARALGARVEPARLEAAREACAKLGAGL
jgi:sarcosine oxidase subunit alpha